MNHQLIAIVKLKKEVSALRSQIKRLRDAYIRGDYEGREDEFESQIEEVKRVYRDKKSDLEKETEKGIVLDDAEDIEFCAVVKVFLDENQNRKISKTNAYELLLYAATQLTRPGLTQFRDWLLFRPALTPVPGCLKSKNAGGYIMVVKRIDLDEVWYDTVLRKAGQPGAHQLTESNIIQVLDALSSGMDGAEIEEFQAWVEKRDARLRAAINIQKHFQKGD